MLTSTTADGAMSNGLAAMKAPFTILPMTMPAMTASALRNRVGLASS